MIAIVGVILCFFVVALAIPIVAMMDMPVIVGAALFTAILIMQHGAGIPAIADQRLAAEEWRLLAVAPLDRDIFIVSVRYSAGDIRTYRLNLSSPEQRDEFLKAAAGLKKGKALNGRAKRGRAGLENDSDMSFSFAEVPEIQPKERPSS